MTVKRIGWLLALLLWPPVGVAQEVVEFQRWACLGPSVTELARREELVAAVRSYNSAPPDVHSLDLLWPTFGLSDIELLSVLKHPVVPLLQSSITRISLQGEGFLMGADGGLVAATDKTTDFWQGDETQFTRAIRLAPGQWHIEGEVEDDSSHSMLIKISTPIFDQDVGQNIGVLMLGFDQFVVDFQQNCAEVKP